MVEVLISTELEDANAELLDSVRRAVMAVLESQGATNAEVSVVLGNDEDLRELNRVWRDVDAPTDVLSFPLEESGGEEPESEMAEGEPRLLGDVIVSLPRARVQADEYGHSVARELGFLVVHGTLHLLGFDHDSEPQRQEMRTREEAVLARLGLER